MLNSGNSPLAFFSYARYDDAHDDGWLSTFRERLCAEVRLYTGEAFEIFQDRSDITWGDKWLQRIEQSLDAATLLIPVLTPNFFRSKFCRQEVKRFLEREKQLSRRDLILPIYYVSCPALENPATQRKNALASEIATRQHIDCRHLRAKSFRAVAVRNALNKMALQICESTKRVKTQQRTRPTSIQPDPFPSNEEPDEELLSAVASPRAQERKRAVAALSDYSGERVFKILNELAKNDRSKDVRYLACEVLSELPAADQRERVIGTMVQLIRDPHWKISRRAANALGDLLATEAVHPLQLALGRREPKTEAAKALQRIGHSLGEDLISPLVDDPSVSLAVQAGALTALGLVNQSGAFDTISRVLGEAVHPLIRRAAIKGLRALESPQALRELAKYAGDDDEDIREEITWAFHYHGDTSVYPTLEGMTRDEHVIVRANAARAIGNIDERNGVRRLIELIEEDRDRLVVMYASEGLVTLLRNHRDYANSNDRKRLLKILCSRSRKKRWAAAEPLAVLGNRKAFPKILEMLNSKDSQTRGTAVGALAIYGDQKAARHVAKLVGDESEGIRFTVAEALTHLGTPETVPIIEAHLKAETENRPRYFYQRALQAIRWRHGMD